MLLELWTASTAYSAFTLFKAAKLRQEIPKELEQVPATEAVELSVEEKEHQAPFYIGVSVPILLGVPIGERTDTTTHILFHNTWTGANWIGGKNLDFKTHPTHHWWINTPDELKNYLENKSISAQSFPARLPLKVQEIRYVAGPLAQSAHTLFHHRPTGLLATNAQHIVDRLVHKRTYGSLGGSVALGLAAGTSIALLLSSPEKILKR